MFSSSLRFLPGCRGSGPAGKQTAREESPQPSRTTDTAAPRSVDCHSVRVASKSIRVSAARGVRPAIRFAHGDEAQEAADGADDERGQSHLVVARVVEAGALQRAALPG